MLASKAICLSLLALGSQAFPLIVQRSAPTFSMFRPLANFERSSFGSPFGLQLSSLERSMFDFFDMAQSFESATAHAVSDTSARLDFSVPSGFEPEDLEVTVEGTQLHVTGFSSTATSTHRFSRTTTLPFSVDSGAEVTALLDRASSQLHVSVPRPIPAAVPAATKVSVMLAEPGEQSNAQDTIVHTVAPSKSQQVPPSTASTQGTPTVVKAESEQKTMAAESATASASAPTAQAEQEAAAAKVRVHHEAKETAQKEAAQAQSQKSTAATEDNPSSFAQTSPDPLAGLTEAQALDLLRQKFGSQFAH